MPGTMFYAGEEWNISFAGCGFRSVYYMGALSCILERVPHLVHGASKISGASSGCLVAASLVTGIPLEKCIADVMSTAIEARRHTLGVFHPTFNLLKIAQDFLEENLPEDGHMRASGRLCVSLTRMSNGENVLVSQFDTREELIQVLMCSCFFPVYCGMVPPSYRGVWYMDGALSNNSPLSEQRNTITLAPFSGESDICPREGRHNFLEVNAYNLSIQINTGNVHRVTTSFCPPEPKKLAEICHYGYMDALHFLRENGFLSVMAEAEAPKPPCCELVTEEETQSGQKQPQKQQHPWWLDHTVIHNLPVSVKKVLCGSCRRSHTGADQLKELLPVKMLSYLLLLFPVFCLWNSPLYWLKVLRLYEDC